MSMPNLLRTIEHFGETLQFEIVKKTITDHRLVETSKVRPALYFEGTRQPVPPSKLMVKSEGERKFVWWTLYSEVALERDWIVKDENGMNYRVMSVTNWSQAGYYQFELIEGPTS